MEQFLRPPDAFPDILDTREAEPPGRAPPDT